MGKMSESESDNFHILMVMSWTLLGLRADPAIGLLAGLLSAANTALILAFRSLLNFRLAIDTQNEVHIESQHPQHRE